VKILAPLMKDADVQVRESAVRQLGDLQHADATALLSQAMNDKDLYVAVYAAEGLAKRGDFSGKDLASRMMEEVDDPQIQLSALRTVGLSKDWKLRPKVSRLLKSKDPAVQKAARETLAVLDAVKVKPPVVGVRSQAEASKQAKAQQALDAAMQYYHKRLQERGFAGNHAVALLLDILKKYEGTGADVTAAKKELEVQQHIREQQQKMKAAVQETLPQP